MECETHTHTHTVARSQCGLVCKGTPLSSFACMLAVAALPDVVSLLVMFFVSSNRVEPPTVASSSLASNNSSQLPTIIFCLSWQHARRKSTLVGYGVEATDTQNGKFGNMKLRCCIAMLLVGALGGSDASSHRAG